MSIYSHDFKNMTWAEFRSLLSGLSPDSPLGRMVQIRLESNPEILKNYTSAQHKIRNEWQSRRMLHRTDAQLDGFLSQMQSAFASL